MTNPSFKTFTRFVQDAPAADPATSADRLALVQSNLTRQTPPGAVPGGGGYVTIIVSGASYSVLPADSFIAVAKSVGSATNIILPSGLLVPRALTIADCKGDAGTNTITLTAAGGDTVDGAATYALSSNWRAASIEYLPTLHLWKVF